jgi:copper chaperone CopZ
LSKRQITHQLRSNTVRKILLFSLLTLALISLVSVNVLAGDGCPHSKSTKVSSQKSTGCTAKAGKIEKASAEWTAHDCAKKCGYTGKCEMRSISIKGMTCGGCEKAITAALSELPGVIKVTDICHKAGMAEVCIDPIKVKDEALTTAVVNKGYKAEIIPAVAKSTSADPSKMSSDKVKHGCKPGCPKTCCAMGKTSGKTSKGSQ